MRAEQEGLVLDRGSEAGHPVDAQPGHRAHCERLAGEVSRYVAGVEADDEMLQVSPRS